MAASVILRYLSSERERLILWVPALLMVGISIYFAFYEEPRRFAGAQALSACGSLVLLSWRTRLRWLALALLIAAIGFAAAQWRTQSVAAPMLFKELRYRMAEGNIQEIIVTEKGDKIVLSQVDIEGVEQAGTPLRVRISFRTTNPEWRIGDRIRVKATLMPPPKPAYPGGYDFARNFYFQSIGAVGYATGKAEIISAAPHAGGVGDAIMAYRHRLANELRAAMPDAVGAISAALAVGEQRAIPDEAVVAMRDSGLAHVLSISGLHLAIAAGLVFFSVRLALALVPAAAMRIPAKKIAASLALVSSFAYLLLAGAPVPAQRSFIMVAFVLCAVLFDRKGISIYALAWAAVLMLLIYPEAMLGPSFHMSFAATLAIVSLYETYGAWLARRGRNVPVRVFYYFLAILLTSFAATLATAPYVIYHFQRFALWGLLTNMAVIPLSSAVIMPGVVLFLLLSPFGLPEPGIFLMHHGVEWMLQMARFAASAPYATFNLPPLTAWGLALASFGFLWLAIFQTRLRLLALPMVAIGFFSMALHREPDVFISDDGRHVMGNVEGRYVMLKGTDRAFTSEAWLQAVGQPEAEEFCPRKAALCAAEFGGKRIVSVKRKEAIPQACAAPSDVLIVWRYVKQRECAGAKMLIDRDRLEREGAHALTFGAGGIKVETVRALRGERPWTRQAPRPARHADDIADSINDNTSEAAETLKDDAP